MISVGVGTINLNDILADDLPFQKLAVDFKSKFQTSSTTAHFRNAFLLEYSRTPYLMSTFLFLSEG